MLEYIGEITDPVHKHIKFTLVEKEIIDSYIFQRLRGIRQLAGAHLVYPSAHHTRFEHSLGTMHLAGFAAQTLLEKGYLDKSIDIEYLRLSALLHDIGHGPFSHLFEEALLIDRSNLNHEKIGKKIILNTEINDILTKHGYHSNEICKLSFGQSDIMYYNEIIAGSLSADMMDYLPRDSFFTGAEYGKIDYHRIISSFEVLSNNHLGINKSAINSMESMLISRYQMFKSVYFHKTVRSAEVMLIHSIAYANRDLNFSDLSIEEYLLLTDDKIINMICSLSQENKAVYLADNYRKRRLLKCVYEKFLQNKYNIVYNDVNYYNTLKNIEDEYDLDYIFVDLSRAPSIPLNPLKEELNSIMIIDKDLEYETPINEIPLINTITGFIDIVRLYSKNDDRRKVEKILKDINII
ncbi:MAG: HD domain-containing protein [Nitrososphaeraceae archaeon]